MKEKKIGFVFPARSKKEEKVLLPGPKDIKLLPSRPKRLLLQAPPIKIREVIYLPAASC